MGVWILQKFYENIFDRTTPSTYFYISKHENIDPYQNFTNTYKRILTYSSNHFKQWGSYLNFVILNF